MEEINEEEYDEEDSDEEGEDDGSDDESGTNGSPETKKQGQEVQASGSAKAQIKKTAWKELSAAEKAALSHPSGDHHPSPS